MFKTAKRIQAGGSELQDSADIFWCGSNLVLVVADGAGGISGGAKAAQFVVSSLKKRLASIVCNLESLNKLLTSIDREMAASGAYGETTCVVVVLSATGIIGTSVGDSGALIFSNSGITNQTANQARRPFVGSGQSTPVGFSDGPLNGTLLVASDGLLKYTSREKIAAAINADNLDSVTEDLFALVKYPSGAFPDDVSVLLARNR